MRHKEVRLGLIGAGPWGRNYIKTVRDLEGVSLTRLASRNPEASQWVDENCKITTDWKIVASADDLDGVIVATPPHLHVEMSQTVLDAGLPVLVEKPLTLNLEDAKKLLEFAEIMRGLVVVDHIHLFHPGWKKLKEYGSTLGKIRKISTSAGAWGPFRPDVPVLWDWGAHDVAMCLDLLSASPAQVSAQKLESRLVKDVYGESLLLQLEFGSGAQAVIKLNNLLDKKVRVFSVFYEEGVLVFDDRATHKLVRYQPYEESIGPNDPGEPLNIPLDMPLNCVVRDFADAVRKKSYDTQSLQLAVEVTTVLSRAQAELG